MGDKKKEDDLVTEAAMEAVWQEKQDLKTKIIATDVDKIATLDEIKVVLKDVLQILNKLL